MKDRPFIFIIVLLIILFAANVLENIFLERGSKFIFSTSSKNKFAAEILTTLDKLGLEPHEAEYYKVIDE